MESENSKKRSIITSVIVGAIVIALLSLIAFTTIIPNATKSKENAATTLNDTAVIGKYKAYASIDENGNENTEDIENLKKDHDIEMYVYFEKDGTGALVRASTDDQLILPFTFDDGKMTVKRTSEEGETTTYNGTYTLSEDKSTVSITDNTGSIILFTRVKE